MRIGIDATNIRTGGGLNHLNEILLNLNISFFKINKIIVWASKPTLESIEEKDWLIKIDVSHKTNSIINLLFWNLFTLRHELIKQNCNILFVPGGIYLGKFRPYVTMVQNLLPFDKKERAKYKYSKTYFRYLLLEFLQVFTLKKASRVIFLSNHSKKLIINKYSKLREITSKVIYHGVDKAYFNNKRNNNFTPFNRKPIRLLYVSIINYYKNQVNVLKALEILINNKQNVMLDLIGPAYPPALKELKSFIKNNSRIKNRVNYIEQMEKSLLLEYYKKSDIFVFASSSETFGMILLEAMASGLPIACSNKTAMPEILGHSGEYFNPDNPMLIANAIESILKNKDKSREYSYESIRKAEKFTWEKCTSETFKFICLSEKKEILK